jgi:hypothetical protein
MLQLQAAQAVKRKLQWRLTCNCSGRRSDSMLAAIPEGQTAYSVEVSGWDNKEDFFVEKTELHWSEQSGKHILLLRPIVSGALVFLRLIDPTSVDRVHPVAYRTELFDMTEAGQRRVRLLPVRPS